MNNTTLMRLLGGGSIGMVLILGVALLLSFKNIQEKDLQLLAKNQEGKKLEDEKKQAEGNLDKLKQELKNLKRNEAEAKTAADRARKHAEVLDKTQERLKELQKAETTAKKEIEVAFFKALVRLKELDQEAARLNAEVVMAKADLGAAKRFADAAKQEAQNLRERLKKLEAANLNDATGVQGTWRVSRFTKGGDGAGSAKLFLFKESDLTLETNSEDAPPKGPFKLGTKANPKTIDWLPPDGELFGIYSLNKDELTITFSRGERNGRRITPKTGDWSSYELKRVK